MNNVTYTGIFVAAAFIAGAFLASPELRAYAANTVLSTDIKDGEVKTQDLANNAVTSAKIKDGEIKTDDIAPSAIGSLRIKDNDVKAQDLAPDSVGASEIQGVSKLIFAQCTLTGIDITSPVPPSGASARVITCPVDGVDSDDTAIATLNGGISFCFPVAKTSLSANTVQVFLPNNCPFGVAVGPATIGIIVYDN